MSIKAGAPRVERVAPVAIWTRKIYDETRDHYLTINVISHGNGVADVEVNQVGWRVSGEDAEWLADAVAQATAWTDIPNYNNP